MGACRAIGVVVMVAFVVMLGGCRSTYYSAWETMGWAKRDILVDRVQEARNDQDAAKEQFKTTLQRLQEMTGTSGGELEAKYKKLDKDYDRCKDRADAVSSRIKSVQTVAEDLFAEWRKELSQYQNAELRQQSEQKLVEAKSRYELLMVVMRKSEKSMQPVLAAFHDQVLFLKHNLNAQAIASLQGTAKDIKEDVRRLILDMEAAIAEADVFIRQMKK